MLLAYSDSHLSWNPLCPGPQIGNSSVLWAQHTVLLYLPAKGQKDTILWNALPSMFTFGTLYGWPRPICEWLYEWKVASSTWINFKAELLFARYFFFVRTFIQQKCATDHVILCMKFCLSLGTGNNATDWEFFYNFHRSRKFSKWHPLVKKKYMYNIYCMYVYIYISGKVMANYP
jgi:hypothetical protein